MKSQMLVSLLSVFILATFSLAEGDASEVTGAISNVILYRGQALVTRTIELELPTGGSQIIVQKLPNAIISETLYAQALGNVTVTSVRYRERAVKEDTREEVKQLDAEIREAEALLRHAEARMRLIHSHIRALNKLVDFTVDAERSDLNRGVLQFEPLQQLIEFKESKHFEHNEEFMKVDDEILELKRQSELLQRKRKKLKAGRSKTEREAVLFVNNPKDNKAVIELSYLVNKASWLPQYNLRAKPDESKVAVEYNAIIHQSSGEDWVDVAMSLSTAQPTTVASPPTLEPLQVAVAAGKPRRWISRMKETAQVQEELPPGKGVYRDLSEQFKKVQTDRRQMARKGKTAERALNTAALSSQMMELQVADKAGVQLIKQEAIRFARTEGVSVTYDLGGSLSMPSRSDQQLLTIAAFEAKADFLMIGTPLLTDYVYLQGDIVNDSNTIMLAGPASMYRDGEFVGKGQLKMVTIGEKFTAGFGVDSQVQISREFKDKKVDTLWGNRVEKYNYRIAIDNYKNMPVKLRLLERIPYTKDEELEITGFQTNVPLSTDADYLRTEKDKAILRWDLTLAPATAEKKATIITYSYSMEYDNDMHIQPVR